MDFLKDFLEGLLQGSEKFEVNGEWPANLDEWLSSACLVTFFLQFTNSLGVWGLVYDIPAQNFLAHSDLCAGGKLSSVVFLQSFDDT